EAREARQEHQQRRHEDLQELSTQGQEVEAMTRYLTAALVLTMAGAMPAVAQTKTAQKTSAQPTAASVPAASQTETLNLPADAELLRSDIRAEKVAILTELMELTEAEDAVFWPIYRDYDNEIAKLGDERVALIADYARSYDTLTDEAADGLAKRALDLESRRQA